MSPLSPTTTVVASGFAALTAASTVCFSGVVRLDGFLTGVTDGATASISNTEAALSVSVLPSL